MNEENTIDALRDMAVLLRAGAPQPSSVERRARGLVGPLYKTLQRLGTDHPTSDFIRAAVFNLGALTVDGRAQLADRAIDAAVRWNRLHPNLPRSESDFLRLPEFTPETLRSTADTLDDLARRLSAASPQNEAIAAASRPPEGGSTIPSRYRTIAMTKQKAAGYLRPGNPDSAVDWLNQCIADGTIPCETLTRQSHVFDVRNFPESAYQFIRMPPR
jgi:hypothetical protein